MVICLERGADLHMAQLMLLPLTVSCFSEIQIGFTLLVLAYPGSPGKGPLNGCVFVYSTFLLIGECMLLLLDLAFSKQSQDIGSGKRLQNALFCVEWDVKPQHSRSV